jgi:menaquinone-9 beta-reductase
MLCSEHTTGLPLPSFRGLLDQDYLSADERARCFPAHRRPRANSLELGYGRAMKPVEIVGGGLAGLTLGIGLRRKGVPVTIWEAGHYPRHRVCGEFISGQGLRVLERMGLADLIGNAGAREGRNAMFFTTRQSTGLLELPEPALCISRFRLDAALAEEFRALGGVLKEGQRRRGGDMTPGTVRASGRQTHPVEAGYHWFGVKGHYENLPLEADLEMHLFRDGYVGLCRLSTGEVNVCGMFRRRSGRPAPVRFRDEWLRGPEGSVLRRRMNEAQLIDESFCAIAGLSLKPRLGDSRETFAIGDALSMIPPITGNGMSMAFESAELAIEPLCAFSLGSSWEEICLRVRAQLELAFDKRLRLAWGLHRLIFLPATQAMLGHGLRWDWIWKKLFEKTRC